MATLMELVNFFDHNSKEYEEFLQDLIHFNGDIPFDIEEVDKAQDVIIRTINNHLNRSQSRCIGLLILDKVLPQCSSDTVSKYCMLWISKATQLLESIHSTPQELSISCKVLGSLITWTKDVPDIQKQIGMQNVKQLINIISSLAKERICGPIYYLIATLLHQYPEVCERFQASIKKLILSQIDSNQENLVIASAKCYVLLTKAVERSFKPPPSKSNYTGWTYNQALICNSLHTIMDELFSGLIELENVNIWDKLELVNISEENGIQFYLSQRQRFVNLCIYLSYMLRGFGKKNSVFPHEILKVLCRGLAIQPSNLKNKNSVKEQMLYLILPKLHMALFDALEALINGFKEQLLPFGSTILQLFRQALQWTENVSENQMTISGNKPFTNVRLSVYECLNTWLINTGNLSGVETLADEYLPSILKDIIPEKDRVLLTIQKTNNLSKRALKRLRDSQYEKGTYLNNGIVSNKEHHLDIDVCKITLNVLQNIFYNSGTLLKQTFFKTIQNIIVPLLYDCYLSSTDQKFYKENPTCRLLLFRVLRALQMNPHALIPLPTQYSLEIFEMALNDIDLHIIQEAKIALAELEKITHPYAPPIQLTQVETIQEEFVVESHNVQEYMEAVEDFPSSNVQTVTDEVPEPSSNKKLKITDSLLNDTVEPISESNTEETLHAEKTNQDIAEETDHAMEEMSGIEQNENAESDDRLKICEKSVDETTSISTVVDILKDTESTLAPSVIDESEKACADNMDVMEETNDNLEDTSKVSNIDVDETHLSPEKKTEMGVEEMLQLFQNIPKNKY